MFKPLFIFLTTVSQKSYSTHKQWQASKLIRCMI
jgi:hypothetical protein